MMKSTFRRPHLLLTLMLMGLFTAYAFNAQSVDGKRADHEPSAAPEDSLKSFPTVMVDNPQHESVPLGMDQLKVDIRVIGNIAVTTLDMTFFNNEARVLEGELYFPLAAGQTVSRFALEVDGKLREGVVVEKAEGRIAYEATVRKKVDPGLLEWTKGNNFKARIYPIPANGHKRIVVAYTQELQEINGQLQYYMPMQFKDKLKQFDVAVEVFKQSICPVLKENDLNCFRFDQWDENYKGEMHREDVLANQPLSFGIPFEAQSSTLIEKGSNDQLFFYMTVHPQKGTRPKPLPHTLTLLWDVSGSAKGRNPEKELALLKSYFERIGNAGVQLVTFSNEVHTKEAFVITSGNCDELIAKLRTMDYDGATQLGSIDFRQLNGEEIILSSDCLGNFGRTELQTNAGKPVYVWNSNPVADHGAAQYIADNSGAQYLDLTTLTAAQALDKMTLQQLRFIGIGSNPDIAITTDRAHSFTETFSLAGTVQQPNAHMKLLFGYGNEVTQAIDVDLGATTAGQYDGLVEQVWAQKHIAELDLRYEQNKDEITRLGKKYKVVTRNTSLIVLDRVEDYVTHRIVPPAELRKEYDEQIAAIEQTKTDTEQAHMDEVVAAFEERKGWWKTTFNPPPIVAQKPTTMSIQDGFASGQGSAMGTRAANEPMPNMAHVQSEVLHSTVSNATIGSTTTYNVTVTDANGATAGSDQAAASVHTQERRREQQEDGKEKSASASMQLADWDPATPYLAKLKATEKSRWFRTYIELKQTYEHQPSFYIDVADFFIKNNEPKMGLRVLSNIAELDLENPQLLRILGHRLEQLKYYDLSISVFQEVKNLRPEEPQSYRDLGLVYALNNEDQQAIDALYYVVSHSWDSRFSNIESLVAVEMNTIISRSTQGPDVSAIDPRLIASLPVDMRVVINWNADNCDIDLWVTDPRGEKCFYSNPLTAAGGHISNDFTQGYGPEEFVIKKAIPGNYVIEANYYGNSSQALSGPTTIQVQMITNYGRKTQKTKEVTRRLESEKEVIKLATFAFKPQ